MSEPTQARRDEIILRIGQEWRGNWGQIDGRDGYAWLMTAVTGTSAELDELQTLLEEEDY